MTYRIIEDPFGDTGFSMFRIQQKVLGIWVTVRQIFGKIEDAKKVVEAWEFNAANRKIHYYG